MYYRDYKKRQKRKYAILIIGVLTILTIVIISFVMNGNKPNVTANIDTIDKSVAKPVVKKGVIKTTHLYSCGHTEETEDNIPLKFLGKSIEQITEENPNIASLSYKDNYLICTVNETVKCKKHYKIQLSDSTLYIFSENSPDKPLEKLDVDIKGLYEEEIEILKSGIEFGDKNAMLEFLEDFES